MSRNDIRGLAMTAPAGWYADPQGPDTLRYWDGTSWTAHVAPVPQAAPAPQAGPVPQTVPVPQTAPAQESVPVQQAVPAAASSAPSVPSAQSMPAVPSVPSAQNGSPATESRWESAGMALIGAIGAGVIGGVLLGLAAFISGHWSPKARICGAYETYTGHTTAGCTFDQFADDVRPYAEFLGIALLVIAGLCLLTALVRTASAAARPS